MFVNLWGATDSENPEPTFKESKEIFWLDTLLKYLTRFDSKPCRNNDIALFYLDGKVQNSGRFLCFYANLRESIKYKKEIYFLIQ